MRARILLTTAFFLFLNLLEAQAQIWEQTNGPYGGYIQSLAVHPSGDLFAGVFDGGLFRSTDNGEAWFYSGFVGYGVDKVFVSSAGNIFIGVRYPYTDPNGNETWALFPYCSSDNGETWQLLNSNNRPLVCWASDDLNNLYLVCDDIGVYDILKSTDEGITWTHWSYHMGADPDDFIFSNSLILMSESANGVFQLIENSWVRKWPFNTGTTSIELTNNGVLLAGSVWQGVYRSLDTATTWQQINSGGIDQIYVSSLVINAEGIVFAGTSNGVYKSTDDGLTWTQAGLVNLWVNTLALKDNITLFAGEDFGVHRLENSSQLWEDVNSGLFVGRTISLDYTPSSETFFAATNTGLFRSTNNGNDWEPILPWTEFNEIWWPDNLIKIPLLVDTNTDLLFTVSRNYDSLYRSSDNGNTWVVSSLPECDLNCLENGLETGALFGGGLSYQGWPTVSMVFKSTDYGLTWSSTSFDGYGPVQCLDMNMLSENLFAGSVGGGIYRSTNQGLNWRSFNVGLINTNVLSITTNSAGDIFLGTYNGVFRSRDEGGNWAWVGLENDTVLALAINSVGDVLAGTKGGQVFKTTSNGETWFDFSDGLNFTPVRCIVIDENDFAMVGTKYYGVFRTLQTTVDVDENDNLIPTEFLLSQNYPNPFNPTTTFRYSIPTQSKVVIKVFDILGNEVATLLDEEKPVGTYELTWSAANLSSGIYFYQLTSGEFIQTRKMILLK